jgi:limonene-1,2-epoxide hydrolase
MVSRDRVMVRNPTVTPNAGTSSIRSKPGNVAMLSRRVDSASRVGADLAARNAWGVTVFE